MRPCLPKTPPPHRSLLLIPSAGCDSPSSGRVPHESFDAAENLPKETPCQGAFGELQDEVPGMPNQAAAGLEQPLLQARQRPTLNGQGQDEPAQKIAQIVGDDPEKQPDLIGPKAVAREPGPVGGLFALLDPLLRRPALVVEMDDGFLRSSGPFPLAWMTFERASSASGSAGVTSAAACSPRSGAWPALREPGRRRKPGR